MIRSSSIAMLLLCVACSFCGKDFVTLGRHSWRCKQRGNQAHGFQNPPTRELPVLNTPTAIIESRTAVKCCCGKICKGNWGLKMHQRSCRVIHGLNNELCADLEEQTTDNTEDVRMDNVATDNANLTSTENDETPMLKKGVNLPKQESEWITANEYFKSSLLLNGPIKSHELNTSVQVLSNVIYSYFADTCGHTETIPDKNIINKYRDHTVKDLKKALRNLKSTSSEITEIKYVSRILRDKLRNNNNTPPNHGDTFNHDKYLERNFWSYVKNVLNSKRTVLPSFTMPECLNYFRKTLSAIHPTKLFHIPNWIPKLCDPQIQFDLDPPTYQQITAVIRKMKASGSPCPLDQLSIICFKRCPYLRTYLTEIIRTAWLSGSIPTEWKRACTILIHKKGEANDPSNFRPITLESIPLKVYTSCLRNSMYTFLVANSYIEHNIQKGFTPNLSGTLEHTAQMSNIINKARIKQRSLIITLLDLKNAFGEVHHNLIQCVLDYHHIPEQIKSAIKCLYTDFKTSIITSEFRTPFITVGRGVLQGDCLSPLLFNMCFNTFIQHIKADKYRQFGFTFNFLNPIHWFQFADDAAVITGQDFENQHLLNRFSIWCQWSNMKIRVDKCSTFGMKKILSKSCQFLPKLLINNCPVPTIKMGESFKYLGKFFDFQMSDKEHKTELISLANELMSDIDLKPLHPKNKLLLYNRYVLSKLSWHFTVASLSKTWVTESIDSVITKYIRKWLEIPICGTLSNIYLTRNRFGLNILPASVKFTQCQTVLRNALKTSPNDSIKELWKLTNNNTNIQYDVYSSTKDVLKEFHSGQADRLQNQLISQGSFFSHATKFSLSQFNTLWSAVQSKLPKNIFNFTIRYINNTLPTRKNLVKWNLVSSPECFFCLGPETLLHVVAGCQHYLERFTWRHDSILNFLGKTLQSMNTCQLFADLSGFQSPSIITGDSYRPDILLITPDKTLYVVELTVGFETNLHNNVERKKAKYKNLIKDLSEKFLAVKFINLSISSLGVWDKECSSFLEMLETIGLDKRHQQYSIKKITSYAIRATYYIFCCRNKEWTNPELLNV